MRGSCSIKERSWQRLPQHLPLNLVIEMDANFLQLLVLPKNVREVMPRAHITCSYILVTMCNAIKIYTKGKRIGNEQTLCRKNTDRSSNPTILWFMYFTCRTFLGYDVASNLQLSCDGLSKNRCQQTTYGNL